MSDQPNFTPGPHEVFEYDGRIDVQQVEPGGVSIAIMNGGTRADAELFSAALELYAVAMCDGAVAEYEASSGTKEEYGKLDAVFQDAGWNMSCGLKREWLSRKRRAAIAKACGKGSQ